VIADGLTVWRARGVAVSEKVVACAMKVASKMVEEHVDKRRSALNLGADGPLRG
jgi:Zn ribbon nucleic-acid-binding protein